MHYMFNSPAAKKTLRTKSNKIRKNSKPLHSKSMDSTSPSSTTTINHYHFHFIDKRVTNKDSAIAYGGNASIGNTGQSNYIQGGGAKNPSQALPRTPSFSSGQPQWINQSSDNSSPFSHSAIKGSNLKKDFAKQQKQRSSLARSSEHLPNLRSNEEAKLTRAMPFDGRKNSRLSKRPPLQSTSELELPPV